jgi:2-(1,2-epoxy-1,2-dihydrophenyl)acetyl-CoA isomerase
MSLVLTHIDTDLGIARITLNRPEVLNAIDVATAEALRDAARLVRAEPKVRCVIVRGAGRGFVAGGDLSGFAQDFDHADRVADRILDAMHEAIETFCALDAPVIAQVHGVAAGAGLSLAAACDLVIAAEGTRFLMAYERIGASPDCGATYFLPRILGSRRAAQFVLLSETLDAAEAERVGLVNRVVPADRLEAEVEALAGRLAAGATAAYGRFNRGLADQLEAERVAFRDGTRTADFREGVGAFLGKRPAHFTGR